MCADLGEEAVPDRSKVDTLTRRMAAVRLSVGCAFLVGSVHHGLRPQEGFPRDQQRDGR